MLIAMTGIAFLSDRLLDRSGDGVISVSIRRIGRVIAKILRRIRQRESQIGRITIIQQIGLQTLQCRAPASALVQHIDELFRRNAGFTCAGRRFGNDGHCTKRHIVVQQLHLMPGTDLTHVMNIFGKAVEHRLDGFKRARIAADQQIQTSLCSLFGGARHRGIDQHAACSSDELGQFLCR